VLIVDGKHALEVIIVLLAALGGAIRTVNYALYSATIAALVLIADDLAHRSNLSNEIEGVLYTFAGLAIGVGVMFLADLLSKKMRRHRCSSGSLNLPASGASVSERRITGLPMASLTRSPHPSTQSARGQVPMRRPPPMP